MLQHDWHPPVKYRKNNLRSVKTRQLNQNSGADIRLASKWGTASGIFPLPILHLHSVQSPFCPKIFQPRQPNKCGVLENDSSQDRKSAYARSVWVSLESVSNFGPLCQTIRVVLVGESTLTGIHHKQYVCADHSVWHQIVSTLLQIPVGQGSTDCERQCSYSGHPYAAMLHQNIWNRTHCPPSSPRDRCY